MSIRKSAIGISLGMFGPAIALLWLLTTARGMAFNTDLTVCPAGPPVCQFTSIQDAVDAASEGNVIKVAAGTYSDINNYGGLAQVVYITKTITIRGGYAAPAFTEPSNPEANPTTLDAQGQGRVIYITGVISPTLEGLRITGGLSSRIGPYTTGGGIYVSRAMATIRNNQIFSNTTDSAGGGLYLVDDTSLVQDNIIQGNVAKMTGWSKGGGISLNQSRATVDGNTIRDNISSQTGEGNGGGICSSGSNAVISNNIIRDNIAGTAFNSAGGGVCFFGGSDQLISNTIQGNIASTESSGFGGGLYTSGSKALISGNSFVGNIASIAADGSGGGLMLSENSPATVTENIIRDNIGSTASYAYGGGVRVWGSAAVLRDNQIYNNVASVVSSGYGGGISIVNSSASLTGNTIISNTTSAVSLGYGGGLGLNSSTATVDANTIISNTAYGGGGVYLSSSNASISANLVEKNTGKRLGGGLYINGLSPKLVNNVVIDNSLADAEGLGSGIYVVTASPHLVHTTIARNRGGDGSGLHVTGFEWQGTYYPSTGWFTNTLLIDHAVGITVSISNTITLNTTLWHANAQNLAGAGTINHVNDLVGDPALGLDGYHLTSRSAAIDTAVDAGVTTDIDGDPRPLKDSYDIGADEFSDQRHWNYLPLVVRNH